ncbi:MAG: S-layer homology domain-containing protein [Oscillospiraceae bacterium]|nr:S-layer homology domain-containing protein [Oscillospiraceae bacterium]
MRNLKKFLALILAMMMALSLMVTANAVNEKDNGTNQYTDAQTIDKNFVEAVDVLYGMGVMSGDYGAFKGDQNIMRSEMAAVLYRLMTGDTTQLKNQLYADQAADRFKDVPANAWYAPYVGWCYNAGIMVGSNGYFRPNSFVTGNETLVMVLRAMGYGKNHEYTGMTWTVYAQRDGTQVGLLKDVTNSHYTNLAGYSRRDVVASIVFQGAQLPTVTWSPSLGYNQYIGVASAQGGNILNPSLGMMHFGLTSHYGIVLGNKATGETGDYPTKIGFSVNPTISKGVNIGQDIGAGSTGLVSGTLTAAEITDVIDDAAYSYLTSANVDANNTATGAQDAQNVTLAFDWDTDLDLFGHKVKVWYDCRGHAVQPVTLQGTNYNTSSVNFGTNCTTYTIYDQARTKVVAAKNANLADTSAEALGKVADDNGFTNNKAFFNYAFSRMPVGLSNADYGRTASTTKVSPINANNEINGLSQATTDWPLYKLIDNGTGLDVVISLELTISKVVQDNDTVEHYTTGIVTENGTGHTVYFDQWDVIDPATTGDQDPTNNAKYSRMANKNMVDSDAIALRDYVSAVAVTGTTNVNMGSTNTATDCGNASVASGKLSNTTSTYYYKVNWLLKPVVKTVWKYDQNTQEVFFDDGTSFKQSIYARAVDGSFKANKYVMAPTVYGTYSFYLDRDGEYVFWEEDAKSSNFVYGTYIDWETKLLSGDFIYPMLYVNAKGEDQQQANITKVTNDPSVNTGAASAMNVNTYGQIHLPKRDNATLGNTSGFVPGVYTGYSLNSNGELDYVTDTLDRNTGFFQANNTDFGYTALNNGTTIIDKTGVAIGAVPVGNAVGNIINVDGSYNTNHLFLTNTTKFVVVTGAGTSSQKATVYEGLADFLAAGNESVKIDATLARTTATLAGPYLNYNDTVLTTTPWQMVYYSLAPETYNQTYDPAAKVVDTVFIPDVMVTRTPSVSSDMYFVGDSSASIINEDSNATLYTMYTKDGVKGSYWIDGQRDKGATNEDADLIKTLGDNVFYLLVDAGRTAYDGGKVYKLLPMSDNTANSSIIGQYYGYEADGQTLNRTTTNKTTVMAGTTNTALNIGYLATTRNAQSAFIGGRNGNFLYNVVGANVTNLYGNYNINSLADLNGTSSLTSNMGVDVSCVLGSATRSVSQIFVNTVQTSLPQGV